MTSQQCKASNCGEDSRYKGGSSPGGTAWPTLGGAIWPTVPGASWPTLVDQYRANSDTWSEIIEHPGLLARFDSPIGFAVRQMRQGQLPPEGAELDRWAARATRAADRCDTYRYMAAPMYSGEGAAVERSLEERVRAIALPGTDIADLCRLADWLEQGATEADALIRLAAGHGRDGV